MQDLLNEDDFIKQTPYNPKKSFGKFYLIALVQFIIFITVISFLETQPFIHIGIGILIVLIMPFIMVFYGKNSTATLKTIALGILGLLGIYYILLIAMGLIAEGSSDEIMICIYSFLANYILCAGIILTIVHRKQKRIKITQR